ncbi:tRNA (adenosine(37)-N6)-dimethylallyltransferase MiaA [Kocuria flava]|uniref:tRNA (adenosine(37)-N6)-dimethylallyltransferase MiaA n=1 Tax=Kocuria flava TaxID=446860 RepID=UPI001FF0F2F3|nr:tRNA (adenosine(37)-N6)-dimethylallyltransferase MiaA [Kocuria flava]MCJ8505227.1 tRNA (adenosine(37)-N6)-dimethylallyltransferase MiaA [Kocuria flava]
MSAQPPVVAVVGPTGTGKSALGVELARALGGEVVNADAMQLYRGMDIGTAKIPPAERHGVAHHLLDVLDVTEEASVADFQRAARGTIAGIRARGAVPVLVGGSGLYVRAALDVLELPGTDPRVRARLEQELAERGPGPLRERLRQVDPDSAARIRDDRRVVRALEVWELTGRPFTAFMPRREHLEPTVQIGLDTERTVLHDRLAARVEAMVAAGLEDEVRRLAARGLREGRTASRALGYGQFLDVVDGRASTAEAAGATVVATRQFARRQRTWFRADPRVRWLDPAEPGLLERALRLVADGPER